MEHLLLHLALDKIGVTYTWSAEPVAGIPMLPWPTWSLYQAVLAPLLLRMALQNIHEKEG